MKLPCPKLRVTLFFFLFVVSAEAQTNKFYSTFSIPNLSQRKAEDLRDIKNFRVVKQDIPAIQSFRKTVGTGISGRNYNNSITIPLSDNRDILFHISSVKTLSGETAISFPQIETYTGISGDSAMKLRLTVSHLGMMGTVSVKGESTTHYFTVPDNKQPEVLIAFKASDIETKLPVICAAEQTLPALKENPGNLDLSRRILGDCMLRTYRFAVAATGEYTTWAGSQANAAAYITTSVNNINEFYERDLSIRLSLVLQTVNIYTNPATDPYSSNLDGNTLTQNNNTLNSNTGAANYDVGMVFGYGDDWSGGIAGVAVTCTAGKGRGAGGLNSNFSLGSSGPIFDNIIAHEVGHQFSATHTMAANNGSCNGNVVGSSGWEPGGGSTIMAYAGSCDGNAYQPNSDDYFHSGSIAQVLNYVMNGNGNSCALLTATSNSAPTVSVLQSAYSIPYNTPFILTANATDADAGDVLTYNWEQMDAIGGMGISTPPVATATSGPLFRSFEPSILPTRYFPSLDVLLGNIANTYEVLPAVARSLNFRVTVRDNHAGGGCTAYEAVTVNVQNCGAFEVTNLTTTSSFTANGTNTMTLTWNPANTCVTMPNIDVLFSTDGGLTYPYTILANTPNDGTQTFIVPNLPTCKGRFMIKSIGNIYYNFNTADITISSACTANGTTITPATDFSAPGSGDASLNLSVAPVYGAVISLPVTGAISATDPAGNLSFYDENTSGCSGPSNDINFDTIVFYPSVSGEYTFSKTSPFGLLISIYANNYQPDNVCINFMASSAVQRTGNQSVSLGNTVTATLCAGLKYVLVISSFDTSPATPALPANYSIAITNAPAGGAIYTGQKNPSMNYYYIMVNNSTGNVVEIKNNTDLTDHTKYIANNVYTLYGISSSVSAATLSSQHAGASFNAIRARILEQSGGLCAQLSANSRRVMIGNAVLPAKLLEFQASFINDRKAAILWKVSFEYDVRTYTVERSTDGTAFIALGGVAPFNHNSPTEQLYSYTDAIIPADAGKVWYRLRIEDIDGKTEYSSIVTLQLNKKWSARIYPNPVQHSSLELYIDALATDNTVLQVVDISGRVVINKEARLNKGSNKILISVQNLASGVYLLRIKGHSENAVLNFIKR